MLEKALPRHLFIFTSGRKFYKKIDLQKARKLPSNYRDIISLSSKVTSVDNIRIKDKKCQVEKEIHRLINTANKTNAGVVTQYQKNC